MLGLPCENSCLACEVSSRPDLISIILVTADDKSFCCYRGMHRKIWGSMVCLHCGRSTASLYQAHGIVQANSYLTISKRDGKCLAKHTIRLGFDTHGSGAAYSITDRSSLLT